MTAREAKHDRDAVRAENARLRAALAKLIAWEDRRRTSKLPAGAQLLRHHDTEEARRLLAETG